VTNSALSETLLADLTALTGITTSFTSKSELMLNLSTNGGALTFVGYNARWAHSTRRTRTPSSQIACGIWFSMFFISGMSAGQWQGDVEFGVICPQDAAWLLGKGGAAARHRHQHCDRTEFELHPVVSLMVGLTALDPPDPRP
jgi:hypothetical protein